MPLRLQINDRHHHYLRQQQKNRAISCIARSFDELCIIRCRNRAELAMFTNVRSDDEDTSDGAMPTLA
jgi:hypothetical protein